MDDRSDSIGPSAGTQAAWKYQNFSRMPGPDTIRGSIAWGLGVMFTSPAVIIIALGTAAFTQLNFQGDAESAAAVYIVNHIVALLATLCIVTIAKARYFDVALTPLRFARRILSSSISVLFAIFVITLLGFVILLTFPYPGWVFTYVVLRTALVVPAIVIDEVGAIDGLVLSWGGSKGHAFKFLAIAILWMIASLMPVVVQVGSPLILVATSISIQVFIFGLIPLALTRFWLSEREQFARSATED